MFPLVCLRVHVLICPLHRSPRVFREAAKKEEDLVPIRVELDIDQYRLRETFVWNLNGMYLLDPIPHLRHPGLFFSFFLVIKDHVVTPDAFARMTCEDLELPSHFAAQFSAQIRTQLADFANHKRDFPSSSSHSFPKPKDETKSKKARGRLDGMEERWWASWRKTLEEEEDEVMVFDAQPVDVFSDEVLQLDRQQQQQRRRQAADDDLGEPMDVDALPAMTSSVDEDLRILIKVRLVISQGVSVLCLSFP